jgi:tetratricopeptide (TPR) repeat protein
MKDEPTEFVERWAASALDADERLLVDTGTTETDAIQCARDLGIRVEEISVKPWRFNTARNAGWALVDPDMDLVVKLDVDEVLQSGWRDVLEDAPPADRYSYRYIWNHTPDGEPDVEFAADHTTTRFNWVWEHPVHESLLWVGEGNPVKVHLPFTIEHFADPSKPRAQYLPMLAQAVKERPDEDRMAHYYARELFYRGDWNEARLQFMRHLSLPSATWSPERAQSYRYIAKMDYHPEKWLLKAVAEDPSRREAWSDLAEHYASLGETDIASGFAMRALSIEDRPGDYMTESKAWDDFALRTIAEG